MASVRAEGGVKVVAGPGQRSVTYSCSFLTCGVKVHIVHKSRTVGSPRPHPVPGVSAHIRLCSWLSFRGGGVLVHPGAEVKEGSVV